MNYSNLQCHAVGRPGQRHPREIRCPPQAPQQKIKIKMDDEAAQERTMETSDEMGIPSRSCQGGNKKTICIASFLEVFASGEFGSGEKGGGVHLPLQSLVDLICSYSLHQRATDLKGESVSTSTSKPPIPIPTLPASKHLTRESCRVLRRVLCKTARILLRTGKQPMYKVHSTYCT